MGRTFSTRRGAARIVFVSNKDSGFARLSAELDALKKWPKNVAIIATKGRKADAEALASELRTEARSVTVIALAREHVPVETVAEARSLLERDKSDALIAFGGGSAIGLAKALMLTEPVGSDLQLVAVPTTFSGSEATPMYGTTEREVKRTGRDERVRPTLVIYDASLTMKLPRDVMMTSLWNAIAHAAEVLWVPDVAEATLVTAEEAMRLLTTSTRALANDGGGGNVDAREKAFEGAFLAGATFADVGAGIHHKLCHVLGGMFALPHAATHATLLPHVARFIAPSAPDAMMRIARALNNGVPDAVNGLVELAIATGVPRTLRDVGFDPSEANLARVIDAVLASPPPCSRVIDKEGLHELLVLASRSMEDTKKMHADSPRSLNALRAPEKLAHQSGFGSTHESEALPGALPRVQNAPRPPPYGLYPELLSGTPFTTKNAQQSRVWMYRVRPSFSHSPFRELPAGLFTSELTAAEPNRTRWAPLPIPPPRDRVDFLDGLVTLGGDGDSSGKGPGYLVSLYAANADMSDRCFSTADGDILIVPQSGTLDIRTELGFLQAKPGSIVVIPRAIKFAVGLPDQSARGWMLEVFGPRLRLPERGLIGSNGLADARHFLAPVASWEDRDCGPNGFETVHKLGGHVFTATQDHSPFDVVAWHGVHAPYSYDLMMFNAMGSVTFDHVDPSIHTVLTAPLDDHGRAIVDFVVFRGRWDVAEHSFRPPFMHRNAASEINGVVTVSSPDGGYEEGCTFVSPVLTSHGISSQNYDTNLEMPDDKHEGPHRLPDESLWIMFESAFPFRPTKWARETELLDKSFLKLFEGMKKRFDPTKP